MSARRAFTSAAPRLSSRLNGFTTPSLTFPHLTPLRALPLRQPLNTSLRRASTSSEPPKTPSTLSTTAKNLLYTTLLLTVSGLGYYAATDTRFSAHRWLVVPLLRTLYPDSEETHHFGTQSMKTLYSLGLHPRERENPDSAGDLRVEILGHVLDNPIGTSAGIDKGAEVPDALLALGGAYVEVGGITPLPQDGNPKPRLFRLVSQHGLINRFGLNSEGADRIAARLRERVRKFALAAGYGADDAAVQMVLDGGAGVPPGSLVPGKLMGVQIAKNKATPDDVASVVKDYVYCVSKLARYADVIVVNVSSPNTENLRDLQAQGPLTEVLKAVVAEAQKTERKSKPKVLVKVSPDEDSNDQVRGICHAIFDSGVDGVIVGNTTKSRPAPLPLGTELPEDEKAVMREVGGYSGPQLFERTVALVGKYRRTLEAMPENRTEGAVHKVVFGSGGITNGEEALKVLNAGADMVQVYTGLVYGGAGTMTRMKREMREEVKNIGEEKKEK
jgi:dihydroorotate dehydrogenase